MTKNKKPVKKESLTEQTMKNSFYNMTGTIVSRMGGLILTVILARFLLPELFGIYSLVLSIITIAGTFTDLGMGKTLVRYVSDALGRGEKTEATAYIRYLLRFRFTLITVVILIIILFGKFISNTIFQKPEIYFPLLFATFYLLMKFLFGFFKSLFTSLRDLKSVTKLQIVLQSSRILFVLLAIFLLSDSFLVSGIFVAIGIGFFITFLIGFLIIDKKLLFNKNSSKKKIDQKRILSYLGFVSIVSISLTFFGSIDILMLGRFVSSENVGYYRAALSLVTSIAALLGFGGVFLPIFTQVHKERLQRAFHKSLKYIISLAIPAVVGTILVSRYFILAIYGENYLTASIPLSALALMILINPLVAFYSSLFEAKEKPKLLAKLVSTSLVINIIANYLLIKYFLNFGQEYALLGAGIGTITARLFYLFVLIRKTAEVEKIKTRFQDFIKPLIASLIMVLFLISFPKVVDMNIFWGLFEVCVGMTIYFLALYGLGGLEKEDIDVFRGIFTRKLKRIISSKEP